ncbi:hypothetical protein O181_084542 [Austropuccinia psidii MF-1]|uniref:Uncharacterized protein n=1 Tax=Austropuccinia psidii MF-1 TaxID=1389203 RepID=A0A9Q3IL23_9BASI|nr:hypothetical protein [Austropuccinia psidii MF-1]
MAGNGPGRSFRPPMASMVHGTWDSSGPIWPISNEAKRGQGGRPAAPKPQVGTPEPIKAIKPQKSQNAKKTPKTQFWPKEPRHPDWP